MKLESVWELKRMALRNLARHKIKTIITSLAIMISVGVYIWMDCWIGGMTIDSRRNTINYETGAARLQTRAWFEKRDELPAYESFAGWEDYAAALDAAGYNAAPRYTFSGTLYSLSGSAPLVVFAVDPDAEARTLAYTGWVEFGRFPRAGEFGVALGQQTADKLEVGVPLQPSDEALGRAVSGLAPEDAAFVRACYEPLKVQVNPWVTKEMAAEAERGRNVLRKNLSPADADRLWAILNDAGRNSVRIATVIDYKVIPDSIRKDRWDADLWPLLSPADKALVGAAYAFDAERGAYTLAETDAAAQDAALAAMIRADFSGALRHVSQVIDAKVVGTINSPNPYTNFNTAYMPMDVLQGEEGMMLEGRVTEIIIRDKAMGAADLTSKKEDPERIRAALESGLAAQGRALPAGLNVFFWLDYMDDLVAMEQMENTLPKIAIGLLFFIALVGISNTMLLSILERGKEIGMMRAMGMTDGELVFVYMIEAAALGLLGSLAGVAAGCLANYPTVKYGVDFSAMMEQMGGGMGFRLAGVFRGAWNPATIIAAPIAATLLAALMALIPTRRAIKPAITESLRFE